MKQNLTKVLIFYLLMRSFYQHFLADISIAKMLDPQFWTCSLRVAGITNSEVLKKSWYLKDIIDYKFPGGFSQQELTSSVDVRVCSFFVPSATTVV